MVIEPLKLKRPVVSKNGSKKIKAIVLIGGIVVSFIIVCSIVTVLGTGMTTTIYPLNKGAICTSKVLELAQKGMIREVGGYMAQSTNALTCMVSVRSMERHLNNK